MAVMLGLHPQQTHLQHGETQGCQAGPPCPGIVQLIQLPWHRSPQGHTHTGWRQLGGQSLHGHRAVNHDAHLGEVVFSFGAPSGDPGGLAQTQLPPDHQGVGWVRTAAVGVVVLQGLELTTGVESVGAGEELWPGPNFASRRRGWR